MNSPTNNLNLNNKSHSNIISEVTPVVPKENANYKKTSNNKKAMMSKDDSPVHIQINKTMDGRRENKSNKERYISQEQLRMGKVSSKQLDKFRLSDVHTT